MKRTLAGLEAGELEDRRALVRVDYNVPLADGRVADRTRIEATYRTLELLLERGGRPVLLSHLGRPKGKEDPRYSLAPVAEALAEGTGREVQFVAPADSDAAVAASRGLGRDTILLLENTRFLPGETSNDPELARRFAELGDLFVNDAFGSTHRAHASTVGVAGFLKPAVAGLLIESELAALDRLRGQPERPFVVAFGGAKIADKAPLLESFLGRADRLLIGGAMANTFLAATGVDMADSLVEQDALDLARDLLELGGEKVALPSDLVVGQISSRDARLVPSGRVPAGEAALDIGADTRERYAAEVRGARTFFWNGPMGLFEEEPYAEGTFTVARSAAEATDAGAFTVVGGGDSASALRKAGLAGEVSHVSTGGGAALEYLAHGTLPGIEALDDA